MCACRLQARPWPLATAEYSLRLSAFRLRISFVRSLSSLPGEDPAIHAEDTLAQRSHRRFAY
jgi:hypothetical protein